MGLDPHPDPSSAASLATNHGKAPDRFISHALMPLIDAGRRLQPLIGTLMQSRMLVGEQSRRQKK
ncbi:hypothetical protein [Rhizobium sp.]|uniref:hypothetical protein n=1 Tax=Rhizobium sp. TaxID=391 RepID=UPI002F1A92A2